jgi:hypothetical protein
MISFERSRCAPKVTAIGIDVSVGAYYQGGRAELLRRIDGLKRRKGLSFHLIGCDDALQDLSSVPKAAPWVRSMSTSKAVEAGLVGCDIATEFEVGSHLIEDVDSCDFDTVKAPGAKTTKLIAKNMATFDRLSSG